MDMIISHPVAGAAPTTQGSSAHGRRTGRSAAARPRATSTASTALDWRLLLRPYLDETHDLLLSATHPVEGPMPLGLPTELATHSVVALRELLSAEDDSSVWEDGTTTLCALQWARCSMEAAVALLGTADDQSHGAADAYRAVSQRLAAACTALELTHDLSAMSHELQQATVKPFRDQLQPPIRRAPTAVEMEMLAGEAERIGLLVEWCIGAYDTLEDIRNAAESFPGLEAALRKHGIRYQSPVWSQYRMVECMAEVLQRQSQLIKQMAGGAA